MTGGSPTTKQTADDLTVALMRECLKRSGMDSTLAAYDTERRKSATDISSRSAITKGLRIEKLVKRWQRDNPRAELPSLLFLVADYLANRASSKGNPGGGSSSGGSGLTPGARGAAPAAASQPEPAAFEPFGSSMGGNRMGGNGMGGGARRGRNAPRGGGGGGGGGSIFDDPLSPAKPPAPAPAPAEVEMAADDVEDFDTDFEPETTKPPEKPAFKFSADEDEFGFGMPEPGRFDGGGGGGVVGKPKAGTALDCGRECRALVLGKNDYSDAWRQGLYWTQEPSLRYGIWQESGGPCGVIAAVQAFVLAELLYNMPADGGAERMEPSDARRDDALAQALATILWQAGQGRKATVVMRKGANNSLRKNAFESNLVTFEFAAKAELLDFMKSRLGSWKEELGCGVVLLMYSAILSRGLAETIADMDVAAATLIAAHGYCSQEVVNLLLTGKAVSNVFDGKIEGVMDTPLKGLERQSTIGYLTLIEALNEGYLTVGEHFKQPELPIFVVCSESHYSTLFATDKSVATRQNLSGGDFDIWYYDELGRQDEPIRLSVELEPVVPVEDTRDDKNALTPPLEHCIRTRWPGARVEWNGSEQIL